MQPGFKIQKIFLNRFANLINKRVHRRNLFIRLAGLEANISCIFNSPCINIYITYHKNDFFFLRDFVLCSFKLCQKVLRHYVIYTHRVIWQHSKRQTSSWELCIIFPTKITKNSFKYVLYQNEHFLFLHKTACKGNSMELTQQGNFNAYTQYMFL